jgi:hypothetical protein
MPRNASREARTGMVFYGRLKVTRKTLRIRIPILLILLFFATIVVTSFHHHDDLWADSDCSACKVAHDLTSNDMPLTIHIWHYGFSDQLAIDIRLCLSV